MWRFLANRFEAAHQPLGTRMPTSIFIAKLVGPVYIIAGLALLYRGQAFRAVVQEFIQSQALMYVAGVLGLLGGLSLVVVHSVWTFDWRIIITLMGWIMIFRALVSIFEPRHIVTIGSKFLAHSGIFLGAAVLSLIIGVILSYFGYATGHV
jgi:uncharacterized membrane protein